MSGREGYLDQARLEMGGGEEDAHRLHVREAAQGETLVLDPVLGAHDVGGRGR